MKKPKIHYDKKTDAIYIFLRPGVEERFEDLSENITVEYDKNDKPIGIEIFNASKVVGSKLGVRKTDESIQSVAVPHKIR
ncbi:DUF2283 domain-containing protein [Candidatus Daviesbacteria bacterium]|nr:DUF2283 domain-containing protein [Candidatus Daviesbacteria bacterium]